MIMFKMSVLKVCSSKLPPAIFGPDSIVIYIVRSFILPTTETLWAFFWKCLRANHLSGAMWIVLKVPRLYGGHSLHIRDILFVPRFGVGRGCSSINNGCIPFIF